jgi:hypothetical protein
MLSHVAGRWNCAAARRFDFCNCALDSILVEIVHGNNCASSCQDGGNDGPYTPACASHEGHFSVQLEHCRSLPSRLTFVLVYKKMNHNSMQ